jgi:transposase
MTLPPQRIPPVPDATAVTALVAFPKGNPYIDLRAELGTLYSDTRFCPLFQPKGRPVEVAPLGLALILVLQHLGGLTNRGGRRRGAALHRLEISLEPGVN